ncbi:MAG: glycosyltransferase family 1 protein [Candidatus Zixiibacteriota bacterium]
MGSLAPDTESPRVLLCGWYRGPKLGVGIYLEQLLTALGNAPETAQWTLITNTNTLSQTSFSNWRGEIVTPAWLDKDFARSLSFSIFSLPRWAEKKGYSAIVMLTNPVCLFSPIPVISVIHDLNEFATSQKYGFWRTLYRKRLMLPSAIHNSRRLIAVSETTARQIRAVFGEATATRTAVIHNGVANVPVVESEIAATLRETNLSRDNYYLIPGRIDPRGKNLYKALELFDALRAHHPESHLVLIGGVDSFARSEAESFLNDIAGNPRWKGRVFYAGFVDEKTKACLYAGAKAVLFLSRHEGFGLPIVEAFSHGCPVIYNKDCGASCEIAGSAGIPVDDAMPMTEAASTVMSALSHASLAVLRPKMAEVAAQYSWSKAARVYIDQIMATARRRG